MTSRITDADTRSGPRGGDAPSRTDAPRRSGAAVPPAIRGAAAVLLLAGLLLPAAASAQSRCRTVEGEEADRLRERWRERSRLRDSVTAVLSRGDALNTDGAVVVWTDTIARKTTMILVDLEPPPEAHERIRRLVDAHLQEIPLSRRFATIDLDAPSPDLSGDAFEVCGCGEPTNDSQVQRFMGLVIQEHDDFGDRRLRAEGAITVFVDWSGDVLHSVVSESTGDRWFDEALRPLAREMRFEPATVAGTPHGSWRERTMTFRMR